MEEHDVPLNEIVEGADPSLKDVIGEYLALEGAYVAFEGAYVSATAASEIPVEGTTTTLFPRATSLACASAR